MDVQSPSDNIENESRTSTQTLVNGKDILTLDNDLIDHLYNLSFLSIFCYVPFGDDLTRFLDPVRLTNMSNNLKRAFLYPSLTFSTHPKLFPTGKMDSEGRLEMYKTFTLSQEIDLDDLKQHSVIYQCEEVRARFGLAVFKNRMGQRESGQNIIRSMFAIAHDLGFFDQSLLNEFPKLKLGKNVLNVDDLVKMMTPVAISDNNFSKFNQEEQLEIYSLIAFLYSANTIILPEKSTTNNFDESILNNIDLSIPLIPKTLVRQVIPNLAKYTIWENTHWAPMFDEMKESYISYPRIVSDAGYLVNSSIILTTIFKRAVTFSKEIQYGKVYDADEQILLHNEILKIWNDIPKELSYFNSLSGFIFGADDSEITPPKVKCHQLVLSITLVSIIALSYIHLPGAQHNTQTLFSAYFGGPGLFLSKDLLFATGKAVAYVAKTIHTPLLPSESAYGEYPYPANALESALDNPLNDIMPSPLGSEMAFSFIFFVAASSSLIGVKSEPVNDQQVLELKTSIGSFIIPAIKRLSYLWPEVDVYVDQLNSLII
ncbi:hypothetical protein HDV02_001373 [Globomyces sp. JEL0801]|nr:hypothetical protein HDV02_001373 [Globomyces sp. JEL0801]